MIAFDRIVCEYPLSDPRDQDREFITRDLGGWGQDGLARVAALVGRKSWLAAVDDEG